MGKTRRWTPRDGEFKKLKASKQKRNKKRQVSKVELQKQVGLSSNTWDEDLNNAI